MVIWQFCVFVCWLVNCFCFVFPVTVGFTVSSRTVSEAAGSVTLQVTLSRMLDASETINLTVSATDGTASELLLYSVGKREIVMCVHLCSGGYDNLGGCVCACMHLFACLVYIHSRNLVELLKKNNYVEYIY